MFIFGFQFPLDVELSPACANPGQGTSDMLGMCGILWRLARVAKLGS